MPISSNGLVDPQVFQSLQSRIDDDTQTRERIKDIVQELEKHEKIVLSTLSNAHVASEGKLLAVANEVETELMPRLVQDVANLSAEASKHPYYKFNQMWNYRMQNVAFAVMLCGWLGGFGTKTEGQLLPVERVGEIMNVPVDLKEEGFHLTIEEYLQGIVSLIDELARLARNSVTMGDYQRPVLISQFIKDLFAGFQLLNLKNDSLRRRADSIKYKVREVEDVVYDLSLRNLLPK